MIGPGIVICHRSKIDGGTNRGRSRCGTSQMGHRAGLTQESLGILGGDVPLAEDCDRQRAIDLSISRLPRRDKQLRRRVRTQRRRFL
jgi:hypothetical protein